MPGDGSSVRQKPVPGADNFLPVTRSTCRKNSETYGWCARSGLGMVGPVAIRNRQDFDRAVAALEIFIVANQTSSWCGQCAVAIITDSECPTCRIRYKDGKALPSSPS